MKLRYVPLFALLVGSAAGLPVVFAHCEVPCGVYGDQARFEAMVEDTVTIRKAMTQINELAAKSDGLSHNQLARWVATKEDHANKTQHVISQYFMTQRLKPAAMKSAEWQGYIAKLTSAHMVLRAAMKCKQSTNVADADALKAAILSFHHAYSGAAKTHDHGGADHDHGGKGHDHK